MPESTKSDLASASPQTAQGADKDSGNGAEASSSNGAPAGTIIPPPDVRAVVEKTVDYIARRGDAFLERIRNSNDSARFSFVKENDPYYNYYNWRLEQHKSGQVKAQTSNGKDGDSTEDSGSTVATKSTTPKEPYKFEFSTPLPPISAQDLEIIKITARYAAKAGKQFITSLSHKERSNFQYDFLKPTHSLYPLFTGLIDQYRLVMNPTEELKSRISAGAVNKYQVLENAKQRAEYLAYQEEHNKKTAEEAEKERIAYAQIDWHDFTVVETILFTQADLDTELPPPITLSQLQFASLEQKRTGKYRIEEAAPDYVPEPPTNPVNNKSRPSPPPTTEDDKTKSITVPGVGTIDLSSIPGLSTNTDSDSTNISTTPAARPTPPASAPVPGMKIRPAGASVRTRLLNKKEEPTIQSPYTGEAIPQSKYDEHMRIMSLDPQWKEQRAIEQERQSTTNLSTSEVSINLKRFASSRSDLFDTDNVPQTEEERDRIKRAAREPQWDGRQSTKQAAISQADANRAADERDRRNKSSSHRRGGP
ncbi:Prp21p [Sugiyamaella lignohabitans]|uniref:Prp21p n=1 Tax=Sugiyamaella lignohabitans TaxID=796027 RepID=A0A167D095_9ASCO|nr:Prp21p [Sugiyamaella lignohabitans]ANB12320.1 Prp21p [Sugiyamaella lignohabitans]